MRTLKLTIAFVVLFACACKKDSDDNNDVDASANKLAGKWMLIGAVVKETKDNDVETNTINFDAGSYLEFNAPNLLVVNVNGQTSQTTWGLNNNTTLTIVPNGSLSLPEDIYVYQITALTSTDLVLTGHDVDNNDDRNETHDVTIQLQR